MSCFKQCLGSRVFTNLLYDEVILLFKRKASMLTTIATKIAIKNFILTSKICEVLMIIKYAIMYKRLKKGFLVVCWKVLSVFSLSEG